jgi:gentisate 1,2-dioxygenase
MEPGDLILTPTGQWHEHRHEGQGPMIWLDVLDLAADGLLSMVL